MLFLAGADHGRCEKTKWTRRYLLGHRRILKKGRLYHTLRKSFFQKENGGLKYNISKPPLWATTLPRRQYNGFVVVMRQRSCSVSCVIIKKEPITIRNSLIGYRLCVFASGSLITDIFSCFTLISVSCLHFGQNNGKFSSIVSSRILIRVLLLQAGHNIHCMTSIKSPIPREVDH